mmetsp:Transcript_70296/g.146478  ORF Transcript_70296/g.146478 Transcript_70296/m.146478 type:complete len:105 (-) Transcript_70296:1-315(-)
MNLAMFGLYRFRRASISAFVSSNVRRRGPPPLPSPSLFASARAGSLLIKVAETPNAQRQPSAARHDVIDDVSVPEEEDQEDELEWLLPRLAPLPSLASRLPTIV